MGILLNTCARRRRDESNVMKIKSDKVSIVQTHSQGSFLLVNPSIPTSIFSRSCCVGKFITLIHIWLFAWVWKQLLHCTLTDKNLFHFVSGKRSQQDARKCADGLNSEWKFGKTLACIHADCRKYIGIKWNLYALYQSPNKWKWTSICPLTWAILQLSNLR